MVLARFLTRPENAHKRAIELIAIGRKQQALEALLEVFRNKKWMYNWSETVLEPIITLILNLCIDLKLPFVAKEIFYQYRNQVQNVNINSLEKVIRDYLKKAEQCTENAKDKSIQAVTDVDDLDNIATPESIMLSAVSADDAQDRSDRVILTPWVKFLWDSYNQLLELLRTNVHVEHLYHDIAKMAFQFCVRYSRKTEFRKLCDKLRKHLDDINKPPIQPINVCITKPETQQYNLDTRLNLLECAIQMELWQEAFRAIEDINTLMVMSKKMPMPKIMANFYQKQAMVFWKSGNYLFHAAALFKLFQLSKDMKKNISLEELQKMACRVIVAVLAIPMPSAHPEFDRFIETDKTVVEKNQKLAMLLGLQLTPTRMTLVRDLARLNIISLAAVPLQNLYQWLEVDIEPLIVCERVFTVVEFLKSDENAALQQYIPALQDVALMRLIQHVSQVYETIDYSRLLKLAKFCDKCHMERLLVDCVRHNDMQIRIDHRKQSICFGVDLRESQRQDCPFGPTLQSMPSEQIRNQLINMHRVLLESVNVIDPEHIQKKRQERHENLVREYMLNKDEDHKRILMRSNIIEGRKEYIERMNYAREEEEQRRQEELQRQQRLAEQKRLEQEREERERKKHMNELQSMEEKRKRDKVQKILQTSIGQKVFGKLDEKELCKLDADQIVQREVEELQKEHREKQMKMKSQDRRIDYYERAKRSEALQMIRKWIGEVRSSNRVYFDEQDDERMNKLMEKKKLFLSTKDRFENALGGLRETSQELIQKRDEKSNEKLKDFEAKLRENRAKVLIERTLARKAKRKEDWLEARKRELERRQEEERRKQEEERKRKEEQERKEREEKERVARLEREKRQNEQAEILERQRRKQREMEEQAERRIRENRERALERAGAGMAGEKSQVPVAAGASSTNAWRTESSTTTAAAASAATAASVTASSAGSWRSSSAAAAAAAAAASSSNSEKRYEPPMRSSGASGGGASLNHHRDRGSDFPKFDRSDNLTWKREDRKQQQQHSSSSSNMSASSSSSAAPETNKWRRLGDSAAKQPLTSVANNNTNNSSTKKVEENCWRSNTRRI